jgi:ABC-type glycerol-3-phosphate transport system substrate-binding protein
MSRAAIGAGAALAAALLLSACGGGAEPASKAPTADDAEAYLAKRKEAVGEKVLKADFNPQADGSFEGKATIQVEGEAPEEWDCSVRIADALGTGNASYGCYQK